MYICHREREIDTLVRYVSLVYKHTCIISLIVAYIYIYRERDTDVYVDVHVYSRWLHMRAPIPASRAAVCSSRAPPRDQM